MELLCGTGSSKDINSTGISSNDNVKQKQRPLQISVQASCIIKDILEQLKAFNELERYLFHLKLSELYNVVDPLRQPLNPLGSRSEIYKTISWIKSHLEEDPKVSLPKHQVYDEYCNFCEHNNIKPLSQADFGKVMKQVYPKVRARRLGTRGNSRYCYSGLRECVNLKPPILPDLTEKDALFEDSCTPYNVTLSAWLVVKQWSEQHFDTSFSSLQSLACYLMLHHATKVDPEDTPKLPDATETEYEGKESLPLQNATKRRAIQIQLQKKIQMKHESKGKKRKLQTPKCCEKSIGGKEKSKVISLSPAILRAKNNKKGIDDESEIDKESKTLLATQDIGVCDKHLETGQVPALPDFRNFQKTLTDRHNNNNTDSISCDRLSTSAEKVQIPCLVGVKQLANVSPKKCGKSGKYKVMQPKPTICDTVTYNPQDAASFRSQINQQNINSALKINNTCEQFNDEGVNFTLTRERLDSLGTVDKGAMDEYLGQSNSQHEEELSQYFKGDAILENAELKNVNQMSQLRQLLQQNKASNSGIASNQNLIINGKQLLHDTIESTESNVNTKTNLQNFSFQVTHTHKLSVATSVNFNEHSSHLISLSSPDMIKSAPIGTSFDSSLSDEQTVLPSPNTRRKHFSFCPISPGSHSPNSSSRHSSSKCSSSNVSPLESPRHTPVTAVLVKKGHIQQDSEFALPQKNITSKVKRELESVDDSNYNAANDKSVLHKLLNSNSKVIYAPDYANSTVKLEDNVGSVFSTYDFCNRSCMGSMQDQMSKRENALFQQINETSTILINQKSSVQNFNNFNEIHLSSNKTPSCQRLPTCSDLYGAVISNKSKINGVFSITSNPQSDFMDLYHNQQLKNNSALDICSSQSVDVKCTPPSRSVPSTPLPSMYSAMPQMNESYNSYLSRSYPSTPLLPDGGLFNFSTKKDCLLNGQPINTRLEDSQLQDGLNTKETMAALEYLTPMLGDDNNISQETAFLDRTLVCNNDFDDIIKNNDELLDVNLMDEERFELDNVNCTNGNQID